jgi:hypothetical protein
VSVTPSAPEPRSLVTLTAIPALDAAAWDAACALGAGGVPIIDVHPADATDEGDLRAGVERINAAGGEPLGYVSLEYATRPVADVLAEIRRWAAVPLAGLFLDHAPSGPFQIGPVVQAVRRARRRGLATIVINAGAPVDPVYRRLEATLCTFEGSWTEYQAWSGDRSRAGDGHLVVGVPAHEVGAARRLAATRRAGLVSIRVRTTVYPGQRQPVTAAPAAGALVRTDATTGG